MPNLFLVRYPDAPVRVTEKRKLTIGRAGKNNIVLPEERVSRSHASIKWQKSDNMFALRDESSQNGTYLNGKKIEPNLPYPLHERDKIRVASAVFTVRIVEDPEVIRSEFRELRSVADTQATVVARRDELLAAPSQPALQGNLEQLCPLELFQMLEVSEKSGLLALQVDNGQASFSINRGAVVAAEFGEKRAEEAVYSALMCNAGTFAFTPQQILIEQPEITVPTTVLLMEGCRRLDEGLSAQA